MTDDLPDLSELEREVMRLIWANGAMTAENVQEGLARRLRESSVRTVLLRMEKKGYLSHSVEGRTYLYRATEARQKIAAKAVRRIADWFCGGSLEEMLVGMVDSKILSDEELLALATKIARNREKAG